MKLYRNSLAPVLTAATGAIALVLAGCAGSAGQGGSTERAGSGYEYGSSSEEIEAMISDLDPVTVTYQPSGSSPDSLLGAAAVQWAETIEERSGGKITVDLAWGQSIAGFSEVDDALLDGRVDIAYTVPPYDPAAYPVYEAASNISSGLPSSPLYGTLVAAGVMADLAWNNEAVAAEFDDKGLIPLQPFTNVAAFHSSCSEPLTSADAWNGNQLRAGTRGHHGMLADLGAAAVSMEFTETYEALQRNAVDCEFGRMSSIVEGGILEVAPHIGYTDDDASFLDRTGGSLVAGSSFAELPLPYQQIIFDSVAENRAASIEEGVLRSYERSFEIDEADYQPYDDTTQDVIREYNDRLKQEVAEGGLLGTDVADEMSEALEHWSAVVQEEGYEPDDDLSNFTDWYDPENIDVRDVTSRIFDEIQQHHRPQ